MAAASGRGWLQELGGWQYTDYEAGIFLSRERPQDLLDRCGSAPSPVGFDMVIADPSHYFVDGDYAFSLDRDIDELTTAREHAPEFCAGEADWLDTSLRLLNDHGSLLVVDGCDITDLLGPILAQNHMEIISTLPLLKPVAGSPDKHVEFNGPQLLWAMKVPGLAPEQGTPAMRKGLIDLIFAKDEPENEETAFNLMCAIITSATQPGDLIYCPFAGNHCVSGIGRYLQRNMVGSEHDMGKLSRALVELRRERSPHPKGRPPSADYATLSEDHEDGGSSLFDQVDSIRPCADLCGLQFDHAAVSREHAPESPTQLNLAGKQQ